MRNYLLAGTSALALTLVAGAANAQTAPGKFDIKIGGDAYFEAGLVGQDKAGNTKVADFENRFRLVINPVARADNGITYGATARIRANSAAGTIDGDRAYVFVSGNFGTIRGGVVNGPSDDTYVGHPMDWQMLAIYDQWRSYMVGSNNTTSVPVGYGASGTGVMAQGTTSGYAWGQYANGAVGNDGVQLLNSHNIDTKLVYYTPRFFGQSPTTGLQGGFSYAPRSGDVANGGISVNTDVSRAATGPASATSLQRTFFDDVYELTFNYVENFGPWMVKLGGGYEGGSQHPDAGGGAAVSGYKDLESFQLGAQVGYANFVLGGGYVWGGDSGYSTAPFVNAAGTTKSAPTLTGKAPVGFVTTRLVDQTAWNVGAQYTWGALVVGVKYLEETDAGNLAARTGDRTLGALTLGGMYTIAPGLRTGVEYTHFDAENTNRDANGNRIANSGDSGDVVLLRSVITF